MRFKCSDCKFWCELEHWTYHDNGDIDKESKGEHCCTFFADDGIVIHIAGTDPDDTFCDDFSPKEEQLEVTDDR